MSRSPAFRLALVLAFVPILLGAGPSPPVPGLFAKDVTFHSRLDVYGQYSDVWGYTDPGGDEYALVGVISGVVVVNITDRRHPYVVRFIDRYDSPWRDIKVCGTYAYDVNELAGGFGIIDLSNPEDPRNVPHLSDFASAHNLYIDEATETAYVAGSDVGNGGVRIYSLASPTAPAHLGTYDPHYAHDVYVQDGVMVVSAIWKGQLDIVDVSAPAAPVELGCVFYHGAFTHNAWITPDGTHVIITDEKPGAICRLWDITDPSFATLSGIWSPNPRSMPHNAIIEGGIAYISYYTAGTRLVDVSDPFAPEEIAYFDTVPATNQAAFNGCWGVFPFYPQSPGLFVVSDMTKGLFVLEHTPGLIGHGDELPAATGQEPGPDPGPLAGPGRLRVGFPAPNPVRAGLPVRLSVAAEGVVHGAVLDARGRLVRSLSGRGSLAWDGRDAGGRPAVAGVYFLRVRSGGAEERRKVVVLR
jgi:choice-of-anchor B domain-containing protein